VITHQGYQADYHAFIVPGIVDGDVVRTQARKRAERYGRSTLVHHHSKHTMDKLHEVICEGRFHEGFGSTKSPNQV